jgi:hypothetical protein
VREEEGQTKGEVYARVFGIEERKVMESEERTVQVMIEKPLRSCTKGEGGREEP